IPLCVAGFVRGYGIGEGRNLPGNLGGAGGAGQADPIPSGGIPARHGRENRGVLDREPGFGGFFGMGKERRLRGTAAGRGGAGARNRGARVEVVSGISGFFSSRPWPWFWLRLWPSSRP